ncbi:hypothetical protein N510_000894 [Firmicutes bacterium ASF500]|nr:hypothetical protein N510_000894 [Firmicutes bacterium ASF500]
MYYNPIFSAFLEEAQFTKEILAIGVTQLYKANYATKGIYYQSFICLSTGIERLEKLCLILDYYIQNSGALPSEKYIRSYGHKIPELYGACRDIANNRKIQFHFQYKMDKNIHYSIIDVLGNFAESSGRYSNVNILLGNENKKFDCIEQWFLTVDMPLYNKHVSKKRKTGIEYRATVIGSVLNQYSVTRFITEDNKELIDAVEGSRRTGIWEAVAPYRQLYMLQIIRYLTELLIELGYKAMSNKAMSNQSADIPHFGEIFGLFYNDNSYFRNRKTWDKP